MKKKMKDKQRSRHEETTKFDFLPPSPPPLQHKPTQDSHYQSSSSPVGRPPPVLIENHQDLNENDIHVLEDFKAFLATTSSVEEEYHNQSLLPPFIHEEELDVHLYDDDNDSIMSFDDTGDLDFFPSLPDKS